MKKTYTIDNKEVILKASLYTQIAYKAYFGHDLLGDLVKADDLLKKKSYESRTDGNIIYLQVLYVLTEEGSAEELPPFKEWLKNIGGIDYADLIKTVSELYLSTTKPDRKNG